MSSRQAAESGTPIVESYQFDPEMLRASNDVVTNFLKAGLSLAEFRDLGPNHKNSKHLQIIRRQHVIGKSSYNQDEINLTGKELVGHLMVDADVYNPKTYPLGQAINEQSKRLLNEGKANRLPNAFTRLTGIGSIIGTTEERLTSLQDVPINIMAVMHDISGVTQNSEPSEKHAMDRYQDAINRANNNLQANKIPNRIPELTATIKFLQGIKRLDSLARAKFPPKSVKSV